MNTRAYIVGHFSQVRSVWVLDSIGVYPESAKTLTGGFGPGKFSADIYDIKSDDYQRANDRAVEFLRTTLPDLYPYLRDSRKPQCSHEQTIEVVPLDSSNKRPRSWLICEDCGCVIARKTTTWLGEIG